MPKKKSEKDKTKESKNQEEEFELDLEGLEEDFGKSDINFNNLDFNQFVSSPKVSSDVEAPVLERIIGGQTRPIFVGTLPQGTPSEQNNRGEGGDFKYVPTTENTNEPKYIEAGTRINIEPARVSLTRMGREEPLVSNAPTVNQQFFERFSERANFDSPTFEKRREVEGFDSSKIGREDPIKVDERKYEKYKPEFKSSR